MISFSIHFSVVDAIFLFYMFVCIFVRRLWLLLLCRLAWNGKMRKLRRGPTNEKTLEERRNGVGRFRYTAFGDTKLFSEAHLPMLFLLFLIALINSGSFFYLFSHLFQRFPLFPHQFYPIFWVWFFFLKLSYSFLPIFASLKAKKKEFIYIY